MVATLNCPFARNCTNFLELLIKQPENGPLYIFSQNVISTVGYAIVDNLSQIILETHKSWAPHWNLLIKFADKYPNETRMWLMKCLTADEHVSARRLTKEERIKFITLVLSVKGRTTVAVKQFRKFSVADSSC
ncbi:hypothetical protein HK098_007407 [Nowakowskiella sp. JEL0407]|nr:hypothetical protein HK098_007407 [Nowakowskiella sp. JEL0407]